MDWPTILASLLTSGIVASGIVFLLKKTFEKGIDTKFKEIENRQRINLEESMRRDARLFNDQYDILKFICELVYRLRNCSRGITKGLEKGIFTLDFFDEELEILKQYEESLHKVLSENRAILPDIMFKELHDLKHQLSSLKFGLEYLFHEGNSSEKTRSEIIGRIKDSYVLIDGHYSVMTGIIHSTIGLDKEDNRRGS